jgi:hypothetical protein
MNEAPNPSTPPPPPPPIYAVPPAYPVAPVVQVPVTPMRKSPGTAGVLSILPGVGHLYLGLYQRAAMFFVVWVLIMAFVSEVGGPIGLLIPFWWFFVMIDAVRQAKAINESGAPESNIVSTENLKQVGSLGFGVFLILMGIFLLLDRLFHIDLSFLRDWWPMLLVLFGLWQVFSHYKSKQAAATAVDTTTEP